MVILFIIIYGKDLRKQQKEIQRQLEIKAKQGESDCFHRFIPRKNGLIFSTF